MIRRVENATRRRWLATAGLAASASLAAILFNFTSKSNQQTKQIKSTEANKKTPPIPRQIITTLQPDFSIPVGTDNLIAINHSSQKLISVKPDGHLTIQPISKNSSPEFQFHCGFKPEHIAIDTNGHYMALQGQDGQLKIWNLKSPNPDIRLLVETRFDFGPVTDMTWTDETQPRLVIASGLILHFIDPSRSSNAPGFHDKFEVDYPPEKLYIRPGFQELVCVVNDGGLLIWDLNLKRMKAGIKSHENKHVYFATNVSGKSLGSIGQDGNLIRYDGLPNQPKQQPMTPFWAAEYVNYFYKPSCGLTFVSDSIVMVQIAESPKPSAHFIMMHLTNPNRECIMRFNKRNIVQMFNSVDQPKLYCLDDQGNFLTCELSKEIALLSAPS